MADPTITVHHLPDFNAHQVRVTFPGGLVLVTGLQATPAAADAAAVRVAEALAPWTDRAGYPAAPAEDDRSDAPT